jgi:hypothetical protein
MNESIKIKPGDVVSVISDRSSYPLLMSVASITESGLLANCIYVVGSEVKEKTIPLSVLRVSQN